MSCRLVLVDEFRVAIFVPRELSTARATAVRQALSRPQFTCELRRLVVWALVEASSTVTVRISR
jgi:hypothetical protein